MSIFARRTQFAANNISGTPPVQKTVAYRAVASSIPANTQTFTVSIPSTVQAGDGLLLLVSSSSTTLTTDPAGWTATSSGTITQGTLSSRILTRVAQAGDANQVVSLTFGAVNKASASIVAYSGTFGSAASDSFLDVLQSATSTSTATHATPAVTTTATGDWIVSVATDKASTTATAQWTAPGDETQRAAVYNIGAGATTLVVADTNGTVGVGSVAAKTFTSDQVQTNAITWTLALKAGTGSSGGGDTTPPSAPSSLTATAASASSINLSWSASTDNVGVTKYSVYRNGSKVASPTGQAYTDSGLTASTSYSYYVTASDAAGNESAHSNTASATTSSSGGGSPAVLYGANMGGWFHNGETAAQGTARIKSGDPVNGYGPGLFAAREWKSMTSNWSTLMGTEADGRALYIDLGSDFNGVNAGSYDATYQAICQNAPTDRPIWLTFCHEPENQIKNGLTPAVWAACQQRLSYIHAQYAPANVKFAPILMGGTYSNSRYPSSASGNVIWSTWFNFDLTHVDALGIDIYPWSTDSVSTAIQVETDPVLAAAQQTGKHICIAEFGLRNEYGWTDTQEASMLTDLVSWCDSHSDIVDLCLYFESDNPPGTCCLLPDPYATEPNFPQAAQVWRQACNR